MTPRRFTPPWTIEETQACFIVKDFGGQKLAYVYFEEEPRPAVSRQSAHARRSPAHCSQPDPKLR